MHYEEDIRLLDEKKLSAVDGLWASLECTNFSNAKGGGPRKADSRTLAWELPRYIAHCDPAYIIIENVREFMAWGKLDEHGKPIDRKRGIDYLKWVKHVCSMGYNFDFRILNAADYGAHTARKRFFGIFAKADYPIVFPEPTHDREGLFGLPKWKPCREKIDLENEGKSIFGRKKELSSNTLRRIAGGIKKFYPEFQFIMKYYGTGGNCSSIEEPLHTITTKERHALVQVEKHQFLTDHVWGGHHDKVDQPLRTQTCRQTKQLITFERKQFLSKYYSGGVHASGIDEPYPTITTVPHEALVTVEKKQFVSGQYGSNGKPEANNQRIDSPIGAITTNQKHQFITVYFNSSDNPGSQNRSIERPLGSVTTSNKNALATIEPSEIPGLDFDIKMRFLNKDELAAITGFPEGYFKKGNSKQIIKMIGNAVPPYQAKALIEGATRLFRSQQSLAG